jgi:single-strand DNA-binding protein
MAQSVNRVTLLGNVGNDPEIKSFGQRSVVNFSLATTEWWKDKTTQEWKSKTEWHRVCAWSPLAEQIKEKVKKGSRIYCEGKVKYEQWEDREGNKKYMTNIEIREFVLLDPKRDDANASAPAASEAKGDKTDFEAFPEGLKDGEDDDLPF